MKKDSEKGENMENTMKKRQRYDKIRLKTAKKRSQRKFVVKGVSTNQNNKDADVNGVLVMVVVS